MGILKDIRLNDLKERGASFIREEEIEKDVCTGTLYYYYDKYDEELSAAEVTVHYFPRGGAEITGPNPKSREGYDKLMEYLEKLSTEEAVKEKIKQRKILSLSFIAVKVTLILTIIKNLACAFYSGDIDLWERVIIESITLIIVQMAYIKSLKY